MVKMLRLIKGFSLFDVHDMMKHVKRYYHGKTQNIIDYDPELAENKDVDNTNIGRILAI